MKKKTNFYEFNQNNSGGSFVVNENVCHRIVIEAYSEKEAIEKAEELGCYWNGCDDGSDCPCCGDRWYASPNEIKLSDIKKDGYPANVYSFYKNPEERWQKIYGEFPIKKKPEWTKRASGGEYSGLVWFKTIEQYCQLMANAYGWTTPDVRIHFLNGTKKEIFMNKIKD